MSPEAIERTTRRNEQVAAKHLRKLAPVVERLDTRGARRRRPEYVLREASGPLALVEVKTIISAGFHEDGCHLSTFDPRCLDGKVRSMPPVSDNYRAQLQDAVLKYRDTTADMPEFRGLPYLVAVFADLIADTPLLDRRQPEFPEITGILRLERNRQIKEHAAALPDGQLEKRVREGDLRGFPPPGLEWRLLENPFATVPVPEHIRLACLCGFPEDDHFDVPPEEPIPVRPAPKPGTFTK